MIPRSPFRHFSSPRQLQTLVSSLQKPEEYILQTPASLVDLCGQILDKDPDIKTLKSLHSRIIVDHHSHSNPSLGIKLMRSYAARGQPRISRHIFDGIPEKNVVFFNVMIRSYANNRLYTEALYVYRTMGTHGFIPDNYTFPCVLKACSGSYDLQLGLQTHAAIVRVGFDSNMFIGNGLVAMYGKCSCLVEARQVLDEMPERDVVSWNSLVAGFAQNGRFDDALEVCKEMQLSRFKPDAGTMASLLPAVTNTSSENVSFVNDMFTSLAKKSLVSWNAMISVYVSNSMPAKAVDLYSCMGAQGVEPDAITVATVLPACADISALCFGRQIHEYVERKRLRPNLLLENALVDMYAKCGCLSDARTVFDQMQFRDIASWTSLITAYGVSGKGHEAVLLFERMRESGLIPDSIAFVSVLSACSHAGILDKGRYYFKLMTEYKIVPRIEHCVCMVDLLGRAGKLDEAYTFIKGMSMEPNERVWGALLSACRVQSNMKIGLVAANFLFQLIPKQSGYYVLLSNIYAKAGRWEDVTTIRKMMKNRGIRKIPGISNVELGDRVHTFLAGDQSHPQSADIYKELDVLMGKMKEVGYSPETDSALHDVEEEDKEYHLAVHSEKLAIAFAILSTGPGTLIRITKNLRVCGDCHIAAKLISGIAKREIILRDANRFHHFKNGICSCGDYW